MRLCEECSADVRYCGHARAVLYRFAVRFECREPGSIGAFAAKVWDVDAPDAASAVALVRAEAAQRYELRFGGDVRGDGDHDWKTLDGKVQPMLLPCQLENITRVS